MGDDCEKAESGQHEPDLEVLAYKSHIGAFSARFTTECLHCGAEAEFVIDGREAEWSDEA